MASGSQPQSNLRPVLKGALIGDRGVFVRGLGDV